MRVVLDACVLYPAALRDVLLYAALEGVYEPRWSPEILNEVRRNLVGNGVMSETQAATLCSQIDRAFPKASVVPPPALIATMPGHPKDRHVVATAHVFGAPLIVTANLRDFSETALAPIGIAATHPDVFLCYLADREPLALANALRTQQSKLTNPPIAMRDLLQGLAVTVPEFVELVGPLVVS